MSMDVRALFAIVCDEGPTLERRVQEAMDWLLSPAANGIGEKLLHDAHALHGKPLRIIPTEMRITGYYNSEGEHALLMNPRLIDSITTEGSAMSVETALAHEMTHAGQKGVAEGSKKLLEIMGNANQQALINVHGLAPLKEKIKAVKRLVMASDYDKAKTHVGHFIDTMVLPAYPEMVRLIHSDPAFLKYEAEFENPAVAVENSIARLRNEHVRMNYREAEVTPEELRESAMGSWSQLFEVEKRPRLAADTPWTESLGERTGRSPDLTA